ncbi:hypothetical protein BX616_004748 [Lobosporangium transversale]|nr:hypothetical protein BX616_004748 [Lobosporangium transversale]
MPVAIPKRVLIGRAIERLIKMICIILRGILAAVIWLVILPYFTIWIWRLYFWIGETFAFRANGLEPPIWNSTSFFAAQHNISSAAPTPATPLKGISLFFSQSFTSEHQWIIKFILDCFEGQVISSVVVVVFVALFLLHEWVVQNQGNEGVRIALDDLAAPVVEVEPEAHGFNVEHAVERFIAAQHHIEAVVEGETDHSDDDEDNDQGNQSNSSQSPSTEQRNLAESRYLQNTRWDGGNSTFLEQQPRFIWEPENTNGSSSSDSLTAPSLVPTSIRPPPDELVSTLGSSSVRREVRPSNERTFSSDPTTGIYASTPTVDRGGRRPGMLEDRVNQGITFRAPEDMRIPEGVLSAAPRVGYVYDPSNQTFYPDTRWVSSPLGSASPALNDIAERTGTSNWMSPSQNSLSEINAESSSSASLHVRNRDSELICSRDGAPLYWKPEIPLTYANIYLNEDGSQMSFSEKEARFNDLSKIADLKPIDGSQPWLIRQSTQGAIFNQPQQSNLNQQQVLDAGQGLVQRINERGIRVRNRHGNPAPREPNVAQAVDAPRVPRLFHPAPNAPVVPAPAPAPAPALAPVPVPVARDDEPDDINMEDLDGILEIIGMHGSLWTLIQNSLLMSALICASIGLGVWVPFMIGKTILLMNLFNFLRMPHVLLSRLTDPILDYIFDRFLPHANLTFSTVIETLNTKILPRTISRTGSYFGSRALEPLTLVYENYLLPMWDAIIKLSTSGTLHSTYIKGAATENVEEFTLDGTAKHSINGDITTNATVVHHIVRKWNELAYGNTSSDKLAAIVIGYVALFTLASWYFAHTRDADGHGISRAIRNVLRQQGLILKMIVFPLFCGIAIGLSTFPLFNGASIATRIAFYNMSPNWSLIMHWLVGTAFMFNFSFFVGLCRRMVRPGVMWFIRDPNDEGFHPIREILERPVLLQLRKIGSGAVMYFLLILLSVAFTIHSVNLLMKGVLPLRWPVDEPISDLPIDMLLLHLVFPLTARWLNPTDRLKILFAAWWRKLSHWLRLSSFMYAADGQRFYDEEGHIVYRSWKAWLLCWRPPIPDVDSADNEIVASGEELGLESPVIFVRDGGFLRVPNTDRIFYLKNRRVLVPVDENGNALDPNEDLPGEIDPLMELQVRRREGLINPKENTIIVYAPPHFKQRLIAFIVFLWMSVAAFSALSIVIPMVLGRAIFALKTKRHVHDIYSILVGVYFLRGLWCLLEWTVNKVQTISSQGLQPIDPKAQLRVVWDLSKAAAKVLYFGIVFGAIMPFILGFLMELFVVLPLRHAVEDETNMIFVVNWAVGLLYMKIIHRVLSVIPNNQFAADINRVFVGTNIRNWDAALATRRLIFPVLAVSALAVGGPLFLAWISAESLGLTGAARLRMFRQSYPVSMAIALIAFGVKESLVILRGWSQYVRDQEYLVGRQLHNHQDEDEEQPQPLQPQQELTETLQDITQLHDETGLPDSSRLSSLESQGQNGSNLNEDPLTLADHDGASVAKEPQYPPLLRSHSGLVRDPLIASELIDEEEGGSIAQRTRLRRSRRLQAQEETINDS